MVFPGLLKQAREFSPVAPATAKSISQINCSNLCIPWTRPKEHPCNSQVGPGSDIFLLNDEEPRASLYQHVLPTILWSSFCMNMNFRYSSCLLKRKKRKKRKQRQTIVKEVLVLQWSLHQTLDELSSSMKMARSLSIGDRVSCLISQACSLQCSFFARLKQIRLSYTNALVQISVT